MSLSYPQVTHLLISDLLQLAQKSMHLAATPAALPGLPLTATHADLRTLENRPRRDGKRAQPSRLTAHQQQVIQQLVQAHGQDIEVRCSVLRS